MFDVLCVADMYLLPGLKRLCGKMLAQMICKDNVVQMWKMAKLFHLSRLEDYCTEYMAKIIEQVNVCVFFFLAQDARLELLYNHNSFLNMGQELAGCELGLVLLL